RKTKMKRFFLILIALIITGCTVPADNYAQDVPRLWLSKDLSLKDTNGALGLDYLIVNDSAQVRYMRIVDSLSAEFISIRNAGYLVDQGGDLRLEAFNNLILGFDGTANLGDFAL